MIRGDCDDFSCSNNSNSKVKNSIEYVGISNKMPLNPTVFKQFLIEGSFCVPNKKPNIEKVVKVKGQILIEDYKFIKTPEAISLENQNLTGCKIIVRGRINYNIVYVADVEGQSVHSAHFTETFCQYIVAPKDIKPCSALKIVSYIENMDLAMINPRCFHICTMIFLDVKPGNSCNNKENQNCKNNCAKAIGVSEKLPEKPKYFKELIYEDILRIPDEKPDIEEIYSISSDIEIISSKIICTENKTSLEGQLLSGCKLIIEMKERDRIVYTANFKSQSVHSAHYESGLKSAFIVIPCEINGIDSNDLLDECKLKITPYIEDICAIKEDFRTVRKCLVLLIDVTTKCI